MDKTKLETLLATLPNDVTLITVSKMHTKAEIDEAYRCGCRIFAENKVQELKEKYDPAYEWHMIGHLQRNKVKDVVDRVTMIQSLDSYPLAAEIEKQCAKRNKIMPVLIEVNIAQEPSKSGIELSEVLEFVETCQKYPHIDIQGLMCIGPNTDDETWIASCFEQMHECFLILQKQYGENKIRYLSMGMSDDYPIALAHGSNMIRLGSMIMGKRQYQ